jgi:L-alanine-DL-glutamate epimerase-like enolase superfamily enzyme
MTFPNIELQEMVRAFYYGWYAEMVTTLPTLKDGYLTAPEAPGIGTALRPEVRNRKDAMIRWSKVG